jgi:hypothetical protein
MKSRSTLILAAVLATLMFAACKKPPEPTDPAAPDPKAAAAPADDAPGTTTNFENPAPAEPAKE